MYGKIFESCFEGSMVGAGPNVFAVWAYIISKTFDSIVEINPKLLAVVIGTSVEDIEKAITYLTSPDPESRNKDNDGRRLIHQHAFMYFVPSWEKYDKIRNHEERRQYMKMYMKDYRKQKTPNKKLTKVNGKQTLSMLANADVDVDVTTTTELGVGRVDQKTPKITMSDDEFLASLQSNPAFQGLDIPRELSRMDAWLSVNPQRKKSRRFIINWLNRADKVIKAENSLPHPETPFDRIAAGTKNGF